MNADERVSEGAFQDVTDSQELGMYAEQSNDDQPIVSGSGAESASSMRTLLRQFGERFDAQFRPLVEPLRAACEALAESQTDLRVTAILPLLRDLQHQVEVLIDRVAQQQAYVLIFGPLKSGKSTFMNSLCSSYVSEVTSLPAYPCLVNVMHSEEAGFVLTHYDGRTETFADRQRLYEIAQQAHVELTERIRDVEAGGEDFDPAVHMPQAVRKIDVKLPIGELAHSGAVLVDTPGLYSRMKFGYDRMTRDFRNVAACAIFIVKTDNLFLEQVFDEFNELLELFSRVFLIVNLDASKRDLMPDGTLGPSLEQQDPQRIIEAFRNLSMSAPLKAAADSGRLKIYPVDLLGAASARIRASAEDGEYVTGEPARQQANFDALMSDLTEYLNSSEYLRAFLVDSIRRATSLLEELDQVTTNPAVQELDSELVDLRGRTDRATARLEAIGRLGELDWQRQVETLRQPLAQSVAQLAEEVSQTTSRALAGAINEWFDRDDSLGKLTRGEIVPLLTHARDRLIKSLHEEMSLQMRGVAAGLDFSADVVRDAGTAGLDLDRLARNAMDRARSAQKQQAITSRIVPAEVPVRRGLWDWILLRSKTKVRQRLFGPAREWDRDIPSATKAKRLGDDASAAMRDLATAQLEDLLDQTTRALPEKLAETYIESLSASVVQALADARKQTQAEREGLKVRLAEAERIHEKIESLREQASRSSDGMGEVQARFEPAEGDQTEPAEASPEAEQAGRGIELDDEGEQDDAPIALADEASPPSGAEVGSGEEVDEVVDDTEQREAGPDETGDEGSRE